MARDRDPLTRRSRRATGITVLVLGTIAFVSSQVPIIERVLGAVLNVIVLLVLLGAVLWFVWGWFF